MPSNLSKGLHILQLTHSHCCFIKGFYLKKKQNKTKKIKSLLDCLLPICLNEFNLNKCKPYFKLACFSQSNAFIQIKYIKSLTTIEHNRVSTLHLHYIAKDLADFIAHYTLFYLIHQFDIIRTFLNFRLVCKGVLKEKPFTLTVVKNQFGICALLQYPDPF